VSADQVVRVRLDIAYDGADFAGWARQREQRTVQGVIEDALRAVLRLRTPARLTVAGRTDAGVHATGQVAHVDLTRQVWERTGPSLVRRLAGALPGDVRVHQAVLAPVGFDARFSALSRRYAYRVADSESGPDPLRRRDVLWHNRQLDVALLDAAAQTLLGEHDFAAFCRRRPGATTIRRLLRLDWRRTADGLAVATIEADAFCHSMVRALIGALLPVGDGRRPVGWPAEVLVHGQRDPAVMVASAHALTLEAVTYPPDALLAARAHEARRMRALPSG
jgi:tRNA pseudouridine38-40 synthase